MNKQEFRKFAKSELKKENLIFAKSKHYSLIFSLEKLIKLKKAKRILIFMPTKFEPDVYKLRQKISSKVTILIPFMLDISFKMVKLRSPFSNSRFNIKETHNQNKFYKKIDMAIVPVVGVSRNFARVGHGKGYYDRFFAQLNYKPEIVFVGIKELLCKEDISDFHDIKCDFYLTPRKNYFIRGKNDRDFNRISNRCGGCWRRVSNR